MLDLHALTLFTAALDIEDAILIAGALQFLGIIAAAAILNRRTISP